VSDENSRSGLSAGDEGALARLRERLLGIAERIHHEKETDSG
jgi:hypothetical protein